MDWGRPCSPCAAPFPTLIDTFLTHTTFPALHSLLSTFYPHESHQGSTAKFQVRFSSDQQARDCGHFLQSNFPVSIRWQLAMTTTATTTTTQEPSQAPSPILMSQQAPPSFSMSQKTATYFVTPQQAQQGQQAVGSRNIAPLGDTIGGSQQVTQATMLLGDYLSPPMPSPLMPPSTEVASYAGVPTAVSSGTAQPVRAPPSPVVASSIPPTIQPPTAPSTMMAQSGPPEIHRRPIVGNLESVRQVAAAIVQENAPLNAPPNTQHTTTKSTVTIPSTDTSGSVPSVIDQKRQPHVQLPDAQTEEGLREWIQILLRDPTFPDLVKRVESLWASGLL